MFYTYYGICYYGCSGAPSKNEAQTDTSNITMAAIIEANKSQNILSRHESIFVEDSTSDSEEIYYTYAKGHKESRYGYDCSVEQTNISLVLAGISTLL